MTGLNLESFLHLLRADLGAWATLGLIAVVLALMAWTSWGSRRALRKCLVLSVIAHLGLALYGGTVPAFLVATRPDASKAADRERIRQIKVIPTAERERAPGGERVRGAGGVPGWDRPLGGLALADAKLTAPKPEPAAELVVRPGERDPLKDDSATPEIAVPVPPPPGPRPSEPSLSDPAPPPARVAPGGEDDVAPAVVAGRPASEPEPEPAVSGLSNARLRPDRVRPGAEPEPRQSAARADQPQAPSARPDPTATVSPDPAPPGNDVRRRLRPAPPVTLAAAPDRRRTEPADPLALPRVTPLGVPALPEIRGAAVGRPLADVPEVYRSRLDPNRSARAYRAGASPASEQAVERALDWLARHQDTDGRWDGGTAKYEDGTTLKGDDDYTVHCPPGVTCFGACIYWEADTALTGLALLSYLGAGYTQTDGKYAETVARGLEFLLATQKPDGDLRGPSRAVGMYCHAMATIALCEAYALTGDERLRAPVERAVGFLARSRAKDGLAWRYAPGAPVGDTSILGWVVMALKSAREVGITVPGGLQSGTLRWLNEVSSGGEHGLARYQPWDNVTPTMTAEAWVCRQFLGVGGPGAASTEAADYLLERGPKSDPYNLYYWYYGTLAMYQHGGDAWYRWNAQVRDEITRRQVVRGHTAGSWDPDESPYGLKGGRIYCTALATLSLEVYYRYLRLYDDPKIPPAVAPLPRGSDPSLGRRNGAPGPGR
jgi:hypothetical protein